MGGFFIGWRYFDSKDRHSPEARHYKSVWDAEQKTKKQAAEKRKKKLAAKKAKKKKEQRERWNKEAEKYQEEINQRYQSSSKTNELSQNTDFSKFTDDKKSKKYLEEVTNRYSNSFHSTMEEKCSPKINRGLGPSVNQQGNRENQKYRRAPKLGALGQGVKKKVDFNQFNNQEQTQNKPKSLTGDSLQGGGFGKLNSYGGGKLNRGGF